MPEAQRLIRSHSSCAGASRQRWWRASSRRLARWPVGSAVSLFAAAALAGCGDGKVTAPARRVRTVHRWCPRRKASVSTRACKAASSGLRSGGRQPRAVRDDRGRVGCSSVDPHPDERDRSGVVARWNQDRVHVSRWTERQGAWVSVMNADGSAVRRLSARERETGAPTWSPDGTRIAFGGPGGEINVMRGDVFGPVIANAAGKVRGPAPASITGQTRQLCGATAAHP